MRADETLRSARRRAGLSQTELARLAGTSQATVSAYESGRKEPSLATFSRLLNAAGFELAVEMRTPSVVEPSRAQLTRAGKQLADVIALAEALPVRHEPVLRYPRLPS